MYRMDDPMAKFSLAATKQREVEPYDDITFVYWSIMTPNSCLLVGIASFASALIEDKYCHTVVGQMTTTYTLSLDIQASGKKL